MKKIKIIIIFFILAIIVAIILYLINTDSMKERFTSSGNMILDLDYSESTNTLTNPERGWYLINACMVTDNYEEGNTMYGTFNAMNQQGDSLTLILFNISNYRNGEISDNGLQYVSNVLKSVEKAGMKAIVRFVYDWDGNGMEQEPDSITTVLKHMTQVSSVLNENKEAVYLVQGILVGSYGEMHGSKYLEEKNVIQLLNKYLELTDEDILHSVRTPAYWRLFTQSDLPVDSYKTTFGARVGLFNDGLCSSEIDLGTYSDGTDMDNGFREKWYPDKELEFQSELCLYVPNGGEVALDSDYNNLNRISEVFKEMHISYLNRGYNTEVLDKWKGSSYHSDNEKDPYQGLDGYKYVQDHLGYRYVLREVSAPKEIYSNTSPILSLKVENTGFANIYKSKQVSLIMVGSDTGNKITVPVDTDIRMWRSGEITDIKIELPLGDVKEDHYHLYLRINDIKGNAIQMANNGSYSAALTANKIGEIDVQKLTLKSAYKNFINSINRK